MDRRASKSFVSLALGLVVTAVLAAQTSTTNVKLGLWEMTVDIGMGAAMRGVDMSGMSDAEKAQLAAIMRGRGMSMPGAGPMSLKTCMTADKLARGRMAPERPGQECTSKIVKSSATAMDYTEVCTGTPATTSEMHLEASSPTSIRMTGKTTTTTRGRGQPEVTSITITGKWVADACGDVK